MGKHSAIDHYWEQHQQAVQHYSNKDIGACLDIMLSLRPNPDLPKFLRASANLTIIVCTTKKMQAERRVLLDEAGSLINDMAAETGEAHEFTEAQHECRLVCKCLQTIARARIEKDERKLLTYGMLMIRAKLLMAIQDVAELKKMVGKRLMRSAEMEAKMTSMEAKMMRLQARTRKIQTRTTKMEARMTEMEARMTEMEAETRPAKATDLVVR
jgi:hypothetical protein